MLNKSNCNETFWPLIEDEHRYLVMKGGAGSGKSIFAGRKIIERALCEKGHRFLICRKVGRTIRNSCFQQVLSELMSNYPEAEFKQNKTEMRIVFPVTESEIIFTGVDDPEKLKSIFNITGIWIEEASELTEDDFNQLDIRLRGTTREYKQIILTFNPVSANHWLKKRFFDREDKRARVHHSTYKDNRFLDKEAVEVLESFKDTDEYYYSVYCLGEWGVAGNTVFPARLVTERLNKIGEGDRSISLCPGMEDFLRVYKKPEPYIPYVIGGDTAGEGSDYFVLQVLNNITGEQVAVYRCQHIDEDIFAEHAVALGNYYNRALIALETNYSTFPVRELERLHYPRQYVREIPDNYTHALHPSFGFRTDKITRPLIIANLVKEVRENPELFHDRHTLEEMLTFVRNEEMRPEAQAGSHDDCIMALAIGVYARGQQRKYPYGDDDWSEGFRRDFEFANHEGRLKMIEGLR